MKKEQINCEDSHKKILTVKEAEDVFKKAIFKFDSAREKYNTANKDFWAAVKQKDDEDVLIRLERRMKRAESILLKKEKEYYEASEATHTAM